MRYDKIKINHEKIAQQASRAKRIKYFLHMHVHAASSERKNAYLYRLDFAFAARMYVSSIDLNYLAHKYSFSFLHLMVRFNCDC